jgi:hypothetical protein
MSRHASFSAQNTVVNASVYILGAALTYLIMFGAAILYAGTTKLIEQVSGYNPDAEITALRSTFVYVGSVVIAIAATKRVHDLLRTKFLLWYWPLWMLAILATGSLILGGPTLSADNLLYAGAALGTVAVIRICQGGHNR